MNPELEKHIHVVSFDIPFPADYGGVIDVFYKIKALYDIGIKVHLHCFEYGRKHAKQLENICYSVHYYPRKKGLSYFINSLPYIVSTRNSQLLYEELEKDNYPILYEGLHSTAILHFYDMRKRLNMVRMHNIEHDYYNQLSKSTSHLFKSWYYKSESEKLKNYEKVLDKADYILAISHSDNEALSKKYKNVVYVPAFHPNNQITSIKGRGSYIIYHGNLSVEENEKAVLFLIHNVFSKLQIPCVIAGKKPTHHIHKAAGRYKHIEIVSDPDKHIMKELIQEAHINILPTFQSTGIKLKLLESLAIGRYCVVNKPMVMNTGLENLVIIKEDPQEIIDKIHQLMGIDFAENEIELRQDIWEKQFVNKYNVNIIRGLLGKKQLKGI